MSFDPEIFDPNIFRVLKEGPFDQNIYVDNLFDIGEIPQANPAPSVPEPPIKGGKYMPYKLSIWDIALTIISLDSD